MDSPVITTYDQMSTSITLGVDKALLFHFYDP